MSDDLALLGIRDLGRRYRRGQVSPVEVVEALLGRIARHEPQLNAWITVLREEALAAARRMERDFRSGQDLGPLHGIPVGLKDNIDTAGIRTTCASRILADHVPRRDATVVRKLRAAGAIVLGKNNLLEFAYGIVHPDYGQCNNPWDPHRTAGGSSSGGAAAVAAGQVCAAIGTDTGGSIRIPAAYCGLVGMKPTYGLVSRHGVFPLSWSLDHVGPLARTVEDAAIVLSVIAGRDPDDPTTLDGVDLALDGPEEPSLRGLRVGLMQHTGQDLRPGVRRRFEEAVAVFRREGATVRDVTLPTLPYCDQLLMPLIAPEATAIHEPWLRTRAEDYAPMTRTQLELGALLPALDFVRAQRVRRRLIAEFEAVFREVDILLNPTVAWVAPREDPAVAGEEGVVEARRTSPHNITGIPAVTVPCGFAEDDLPAGLQIAGPWRA
ncbi:MAG TPA: amidase, partial [bacterium]|nr:amidase [bacterium]